MGFSALATRDKLNIYLRQDLLADLAAGVTGATAGAPQAMAFAIVAGISPIYGLYTAIVSTIVASLFGSSTMMTTGPTNALAVVVASTLAPFTDSGDLLARLVTLTFLVGAIQLVMGLLRLGGLTRFVSAAVMTGFVTGAALLVLLGQLSHLTGITTGSHRRVIEGTFDLARQLDQIHPQTFVVGLVAIALIVILHQTRLSSFATLIAIIVTTIAVALFGWDAAGVELVRDLSPIPNRLPDLTLPDSGLMGDLVTAALAIAVLGLVQTAALAQSLKEKDDRIPDASREFVGQGLGNMAGALFQNMPAGGSLSRTAVNMKAGARTRLANVWAGIFVLLIMLLFGGMAERITLAALAGHLVVAAATLISPARIGFIWRASWTGRWAMVATFVSTLVLPLEYSVYVGVVLSLAIYVQQSSHMKITQLDPVGVNMFREIPFSGGLPDAEPVILSIHGDLYFAAMRDLAARLPDPNGAQRPVVILRLRGDTLLAGTGTTVLVSYAERLRARGGLLILCGVEKPVLATLRRTGALPRIGRENVFLADEFLLASTQAALDRAQAWLAEHSAPHPTDETPVRQA
jgi:SulP family sulfate permease